MAVHVLAILAREEGERVSSALLAESVNTNPVIIRRLLLVLQGAHLVETRKGAGFGSRLGRSAASINLAQVYRAVEGDETFVMPRREPNGACPVGRGIRAALERVFVSAQEALERDLARTTLAGILEMVKTSSLPAGRANAALSGIFEEINCSGNSHMRRRKTTQH
jgi:DNA-binding IscR family transcriptional regulator